VIGDTGAPEFEITALDLGASDVLAGPCDTEELVLRLRARLREKRASDRRRAAVERELHHAVTDLLTGLPNRRAAFARLAQISARCSLGYALMILDLDRFKEVNDRHGHPAGDIVLREVARRLAGNLRQGDLVARIGGEEFLVVLPETPLVPARVAAERLRRAVEAQPVSLGSGEAIYVTLSIGLCLGRGPGDTVEAALSRADKALYLAKSSGRNTVSVVRSVA
jgi:two-component system cell cycle response regulator